MFIFSLFFLLRAAVPQPLNVGLVSGHIYKNEPHRIAAFASNQQDAGKYAGILHAKKITSPITSIGSAIGSFFINQVYQTHGGWIVNHYEGAANTGRVFDSYIVSAAASWEALKATLSNTLTSFMRDYTIAFPQIVLPTMEYPKISETALSKFVDACNNRTLSSYSLLSDTIHDAENAWIKSQIKSGKLIFPNRPTQTGGLSRLPIIVEATKNLPPKQQVDQFYKILEQSKFFEVLNNGTWGGNNCMFAAIAHHSEVIKEIVETFGKEENLDPNDSQFIVSEKTAGGKTLRRIVCQWILDHMNDVLFPETKTKKPLLTVKDIVNSIRLRHDRFDPQAYIKELKDGTGFIDEEILAIISALIGRPIIVLTQQESILTSNFMETILSRRTWQKTPIYLYNDSQASSASSYSGGHYSGLSLT